MVSRNHASERRHRMHIWQLRQRAPSRLMDSNQIHASNKSFCPPILNQFPAVGLCQQRSQATAALYLSSVLWYWSDGKGSGGARNAFVNMAWPECLDRDDVAGRAPVPRE